MTARRATHRSLQIALALLVALLLPTAALVALAYSFINIPGPAGSGFFGNTVTVLPNGNFVVDDPLYASGVVTQVGAVYLYDGVTHQLISTLVGSHADDEVGVGGIYTLTNGNYVVASDYWYNGPAAQAGAATLCSGTTGCQGTVSTANSLVGSHAGDRVGSFHGVYPLTNGNYVVASSNWQNGAKANAGAATWCSGTTGCTGVVTTTNSLVGGRAGDQVGSGGLVDGVTALSNGNYVVSSPMWDNGVITTAGAATWCSGTAPCTGSVNTSNSLVGTQVGDLVGNGGIVALSNGNFVVDSWPWHNGAKANAGAITWCSGTTGCAGEVVTTTNSLVGGRAGDQVGLDGIALLSNGDYVVASPFWHNGVVASAGAATWCSGSAPCTGPVTTANSLVGSTASDEVGDGITALSNGNYVVSSPFWTRGAIFSAGAATWCSGSAPCTGPVTTTNSLVGRKAFDDVALGVAALSDGNYVVRSPLWDKGAVTDVGAATWCSGTAGCQGPVTTANSLVGSTAGDEVSGNYGDVVALTDGRYVVDSPNWANGVITATGAATLCSGAGGCAGQVVTTANSLVGSQAGDQVGLGGVTLLRQGNYVVSSPYWYKGAVARAGAATWCSGAGGCAGQVVTTTNSLVGSRHDDSVSCCEGVTALNSGNYAVVTINWHNGAGIVGAVTLGSGTAGAVGPITAANSVIGTAVGPSPIMVVADDSLDDQLVVGRPRDNLVSLLGLFKLHLPLVTRQ